MLEKRFINVPSFFFHESLSNKLNGSNIIRMWCCFFFFVVIIIGLSMDNSFLTLFLSLQEKDEQKSTSNRIEKPAVMLLCKRTKKIAKNVENDTHVFSRKPYSRSVFQLKRKMDCYNDEDSVSFLSIFCEGISIIFTNLMKYALNEYTSFLSLV